MICKKCNFNIRYISNRKCVYCYRKKSRRKSKRRRNDLKKATPSWAKKDPVSKTLKRIYKKAQEMGMTVDHIYPLRHRKLCGLHVPANLRIISMEENAKKKNKIPTLKEVQEMQKLQELIMKS